MTLRPTARRQEQVLACARSLGFQHYVHAPDVPLLGGWASVLGGWAGRALQWAPNLTQWIDAGVLIRETGIGGFRVLT